jgi:hypothetical protein
MSELARRLQVSRGWIEHHVRNGKIAIVRDAAAKRYLFPDTQKTIDALKKLRSGRIDHISFVPSASK